MCASSPSSCRCIVRTVTAEASAPAAGKELPAVVAAFEQALGQVLDKTVSAILTNP
jgi:ABC-type uncharacterized transport system auxiliary subunit